MSNTNPLSAPPFYGWETSFSNANAARSENNVNKGYCSHNIFQVLSYCPIVSSISGIKHLLSVDSNPSDYPINSRKLYVTGGIIRIMLEITSLSFILLPVDCAVTAFRYYKAAKIQESLNSDYSDWINELFIEARRGIGLNLKNGIEPGRYDFREGGFKLYDHEQGQWRELMDAIPKGTRALADTHFIGLHGKIESDAEGNVYFKDMLKELDNTKPNILHVLTHNLLNNRVNKKIVKLFLSDENNNIQNVKKMAAQIHSIVDTYKCDKNNHDIPIEIYYQDGECICKYNYTQNATKGAHKGIPKQVVI